MSFIPGRLPGGGAPARQEAEPRPREGEHGADYEAALARGDHRQRAGDHEGALRLLEGVSAREEREGAHQLIHGVDGVCQLNSLPDLLHHLLKQMGQPKRRPGPAKESPSYAHVPGFFLHQLLVFRG